MKNRSGTVPMLIALLGALCLILDSRCASEAAAEGLKLCLGTVVPSLFPLFVLSGILVPQLSSVRMPGGFSRFLGIPRGAEGIFLLGCVGGFPMGAQCITQAVEARRLSREDGERMLGFCDNCGPAFLFGILPAVFDDPLAPLWCFLIQLETAVLIASLWPEKSRETGQFSVPSVSLPQAVPRAVRSLTTVCAWIVLACVLTGFLRRWLFPFLPQTIQVVCTGLLELTSGCTSLSRIADPTLRLMLCCGFLCFGGLSVLLQIRGICTGLSIRTCILQKALQAALAMGLAAGIGRFGPAWLLVPIPACCFFKKQWNFLLSCGIIPSKREVSDHAVS